MTSKDYAKRSLLERIMDRSVPLREIDNGIPFNLIVTAVRQSIPAARQSDIEPPKFGFSSTESILATAIQFLQPSDWWILAILVSDLVRWVWTETRGEGVSWMDHLGKLPIVVPHPHYRERMGVLVRQIVYAKEDHPLVLELRSDLDDLVYSVFGVSCRDISIIEG